MKTASGIIGVMIILLGCGETLTSSYSTIEQARSAGAIQRGWVPDNLPKGTTDIHETHNLDSNVIRGSFRFASQEETTFRATLKPDLRIKSQNVSLEGASAHNLQTKETTQSLAKHGYQLFSYHDYCFAVHWDQAHGFYWNCK